ncbi:MAG: nitroreductase family protein [Actinobacteria bacterium]|nr:nitroreductase family protein [Actinomycetota bacterium]
MRRRADDLLADMRRRRSVRRFSTEPVPRDLVATALEVAGTAPSGAHKQPWRFVVVTDAELKARIRAAAEEEERDFYRARAPQHWLDALAPLGTDEVKTHLTDAPYVIVMFKVRHGVQPDGAIEKHYYATESCGIAAGFLIAALHRVGLATLPHTPSPMAFLSEVLGRPAEEQPFLVLPVGYPAPDAEVPDLGRKPLDDIVVWH